MVGSVAAGSGYLNPFTRAFPVWRELKLNSTSPSSDSTVSCSHVLSRLKGIETSLRLAVSFAKAISSHVLSRLKGIETSLPGWVALKLVQFKFTRAFPFEGNWNSWQGSLTSITKIGSHVLSRLKGIETYISLPPAQWCLPRVHTCFPVWRELKPYSWKNCSAAFISSHVLSRLKGIETISDTLVGLSTSLRSSHVLSRLKGIETY